jgi:predicted nucleic acid-binding protein
MVIDCSVLSAVLFEEETREAAGQLLSGKTLHAPLLLDSEIVRVAAKKKRAGGASALIVQALVDYGQQEIEFHRPDVETQFALSLRYQISPYDAAYLCVAALLQAPLATFDAKLAKAARAHLAGPS